MAEDLLREVLGMATVSKGCPSGRTNATLSQKDGDVVSSPPPPPPRIPGSTLRNREWRRRKAEGLRLVPPLEIRETEIDVLVQTKLLKAQERGDGHAVIAALYVVLDRAIPALERGELKA